MINLKFILTTVVAVQAMKCPSLSSASSSFQCELSDPASLKSASIAVQLDIAYSSFSLITSSLVYFGKISEKKHVCAVGKKTSGLVLAPSPTGDCTLNFCVKSSVLGGSRDLAQTKRRNCCLSSLQKVRRTRLLEFRLGFHSMR